MPRRRRPDDPYAARVALRDDLEAGRLSLGEALRRMRRIVGLTQTEYAELAGVAPRALMDLERGVGNPTLATLDKLGRPFGLGVCFCPRQGEG